MKKLNFNALTRGKTLWIAGLILLALITCWMLSSLEQEISRVEIVPDDDLLAPSLGSNIEDDITEGDYAENEAFFVEYRLQRERVRDQEIEVLQEMVEKTAATEEGKRDAEKQILDLVEMMELELKVENLVKAQGYEDAIFFFDNDIATVMVQVEELSEREFARIADAVAKVTGVERETVRVISGADS